MSTPIGNEPPQEPRLERGLEGKSEGVKQPRDPSRVEERVHALFMNIDHPVEVARQMRSIRDVCNFIQGSKGGIRPDQITAIGNLPASGPLIVNSFAEYCANHPTSFLALVCQPAMERLLAANRDLNPKDALNQVLLQYLEAPIPEKFLIRDVSAFFKRIEASYESDFREGYELFFDNLLKATLDSGETIGSVIGETLTDEGLTLEAMARIIQKLHQPAYQDVFRQVDTLSIQSYFDTAYLPPEYMLFTHLQVLEIGNCLLSSVALRSAPGLNRLDVNKNKLTHLDLSATPALTCLVAAENDLRELDVSRNRQLYHLDVSENHLSTLDLSQNRALGELYVRDNELETIDVHQHQELAVLHASGNHIREIELRTNLGLKELVIARNQLKTLELRYNPALVQLDVSDNQLTTIDLSCNPLLTTLNVSNNQLDTLDVSNNMALTHIDARGNRLRVLDLTHNPDVQEVFVDPEVQVIGAGPGTIISRTA